jgi:hypothetical protein
MRCSILFSLLIASIRVAADTVWVTPHDSYGSAVGVLGCKINTNRVAYWPMDVDCNNICVSLSYGDQQVYLLRVDQSGGAYDVSYDAWNYLITGYSATTDPTAGGATAMEYENVDASMCADLIQTNGHKLPLSAANSMNFLSSCLSQSNSWVANNYVLYNILDSICTWGYDEVCTLDLSTSNQPTCPHTLGDPVVLTGNPVYNIEYPSGKSVLASSPGQTTQTAQTAPTATKPSLGRKVTPFEDRRLALLVITLDLLIYSLLNGL